MDLLLPADCPSVFWGGALTAMRGPHKKEGVKQCLVRTASLYRAKVLGLLPV